MSKVLLHNLTHPFRECEPEIFDHDQLAVFMAEPGDIVVSRKPIDNFYLDFLSSLGYDFTKNIFVHSDKGLPAFDSVFSDEDIIRKIRAAIAGKKYRFDVYAPTFYEYEFAQKIGADFLENPDHYFRWGTKSGFRRIAKELAVPVPYGFEDINITDCISLFKKLVHFFRQGIFRVVLKPDEGAAGLDTRRLEPIEALRLLLNFNESAARISSPRLIPLKSSLFVLEAWHEDVVCSPGIQLLVEETGTVRTLSVYLQILEKNGLTYRGCLSQEFVPDRARNALAEGAIKIAENLSRNGFRGYLSFDTILLKSSELLFTDLNPRKVLSLYPQLIANKLGGGFGGLCYASLRVRSRRAQGFDAAELIHFLEPAVFNPESGRGCIPYDYGLLKKHGIFRLLVLEKSPKKVSKLLKELVDKLGCQ